VDPEAELLGDEPVRLPRGRRDAEPEILDAVPRELWRPPRWVHAVIVLAVLAATGAWYADRQARAHESAALARCQQELHGAVISSDLQLLSAAANIRPTVESTTGRKHAAVLGLMSTPARHVVPDVVSADQLCRAVSIRFWHRSLKAQHDAVTAYSAALAAKLREIAADGGAYYHDDSSLRRLRRAADIGVVGGRY
jgi:hypothetical protein